MCEVMKRDLYVYMSGFFFRFEGGERAWEMRFFLWIF